MADEANNEAIVPHKCTLHQSSQLCSTLLNLEKHCCRHAHFPS